MRCRQHTRASTSSAQGTEAGGHTGHVSTLTLVPAVVDAVAPIPVLAAGGIADGRAIAAALMLGAEGVWIGTRFLATHECGVSDAHKAAVIDATTDATILTDVYDKIPMPVIVVTRLRLRDPALFDAFVGAAFAVFEQAQRSDGNWLRICSPTPTTCTGRAPRGETAMR